MGLQTETNSISACKWDKNKLPPTTPIFSRSSNTMTMIKHTVRLIAGRRKFKMAAYTSYISACRWDKKSCNGYIPAFYRSPQFKSAGRNAYNVAGRRKSEMAAVEPELLISHLVRKIATKFHRLHLCYRYPAVHWFSAVAINFWGGTAEDPGVALLSPLPPYLVFSSYTLPSPPSPWNGGSGGPLSQTICFQVLNGRTWVS